MQLVDALQPTNADELAALERQWINFIWELDHQPEKYVHFKTYKPVWMPAPWKWGWSGFTNPEDPKHPQLILRYFWNGSSAEGEFDIHEFPKDQIVAPLSKDFLPTPATEASPFAVTPKGRKIVLGLNATPYFIDLGGTRIVVDTNLGSKENLIRFVDSLTECPPSKAVNLGEEKR